MADRPTLSPAGRGLTVDDTLMTGVTHFYRKFVALSLFQSSCHPVASIVQYFGVVPHLAESLIHKKIRRGYYVS